MLLILSFYSTLYTLKCNRLEFCKELLYGLKNSLVTILRNQKRNQVRAYSNWEWKIETNTEYSVPSLLSMESTCCSSFLSISRYLHWSARDLYLVNNLCTILKLLGCKKKKRFEKKNCPYCMRGFNSEDSCMKKTLDQLKALFLQNNISLTQGA